MILIVSSLETTVDNNIFMLYILPSGHPASIYAIEYIRTMLLCYTAHVRIAY